MKKICKIAVIFLIILSLYTIVFKVNATNFDIWNTGKNFLDLGSQGYNNTGADDINISFANIVDFLWGLGLLVVMASTVVLGIRYMLVNPNEKSRVKQATTPYILGVVIIFGAVTIWKLLIDILEGSMGIGG